MGGGAQKKKWTIARRAVQVAALIVFSLPLLVAGWGLLGLFTGGDAAVPTPAEGVFFGSLSASSVACVSVLDPFAALQIAAASRTFDASWLLAALPVLVVYGLIRGRAFCGWVCPVNLLCELVDWLRGKLGLKVAERAVPRHAKIYVALGVVALSAIVGVPVFEAVSPISAVNKGLLFGALAGVFTLVAIVVVELFWARRVWCRALCPLGGFYEALGRVGQANVRIDHASCIHCDKCRQACLADPEILEPALSAEDGIVRAGDCMACGACIDACPTGALAMGLGRPRTSGAAQANENVDRACREREGGDSGLSGQASH